MKKIYTFLDMETRERPSYSYPSGKCADCFRESYYFEYYKSKKKLRKTLKKSDYFKENPYGELIMVEVYFIHEDC